jgi:TatA/E family protein of Tat protein translocase
MFGMGMPEIIMILAVALIFIGPRKLPELAKTLGKAMGEFRRATSDLKDSINIDAVEKIRESDKAILIDTTKPDEVHSEPEPETPGETIKKNDD